MTLSKSIRQINWKTIAFFFFVSVVADQYTKLLIRKHIAYQSANEVIPGFFDITYHFNPGAAFGMFANLGETGRLIVMNGLWVVAVGMVIYLLLTEHFSHRLAQVAISLILGGAIGNLIDRWRFGQVVDFLDFYIKDWHWPAFNVADSCICIGVAILLFCNKKVPATTKPEEIKVP